jgi:hypothetical protein
LRIPSATTGSVTVWVNSVATAPGEMMVDAVVRPDSAIDKTLDLIALGYVGLNDSVAAE